MWFFICTAEQAMGQRVMNGSNGSLFGWVTGQCTFTRNLCMPIRAYHSSCIYDRGQTTEQVRRSGIML